MRSRLLEFNLIMKSIPEQKQSAAQTYANVYKYFYEIKFDYNSNQYDSGKPLKLQVMFNGSLRV